LFYYLLVLLAIEKIFFKIEKYINHTKFTDEATEPRRESETDWDRRISGPVFACARRKLPWTDCGRDDDRWLS